MNPRLEPMFKFLKERRQLAGELGIIWRGTSILRFGLNVIRRYADPAERLAAYDALVDYYDENGEVLL